MTTMEMAEFADVLNRVASWPPQLRITLARQVLESVEHSSEIEAGRRPGEPLSKQRVADLLHSLPVPKVSVPAKSLPLERVIGMLKTDGPTPTDAECEQILEDERLRKYG